MKTIKYEPKSDFSFCLQINFFSTCEINLPDFFSFFFFSLQKQIFLFMFYWTVYFCPRFGVILC